jgi:hypothetical protein
LLVRDGRDVVEWMIRSFGLSHEAAAPAWCRAARKVAEFAARRENSAR